MKWFFVAFGLFMIVAGGIRKYLDWKLYREEFICGHSWGYAVFMTGVITVILGLSFDWIMSLDEEDEAPEDTGADDEDESAKDAAADEGPEGEEGSTDEESGEPAEPTEDQSKPEAESEGQGE